MDILIAIATIFGLPLILIGGLVGILYTAVYLADRFNK